MLFLPTAVFLTLSRQGIEFRRFDPMHDLDTFARGRDIEKPAARPDRMLIELQDAEGEGIAPAEIVKQPAVDLRGLKSLLDFSDTFRRSWCCAHLINNEQQRANDGESEDAFH